MIEKIIWYLKTFLLLLKFLQYILIILGILLTSFGWWESFVPDNEENSDGVLRTNVMRLITSPLGLAFFLSRILYKYWFKYNDQLWRKHWPAWYISRINIILLCLGGCKTCVKRWWNTLDTAHILWYQFGRWDYFWYYHGESLSTTKLWENQGKRSSNLWNINTHSIVEHNIIPFYRNCVD